MAARPHQEQVEQAKKERSQQRAREAQANFEDAARDRESKRSQELAEAQLAAQEAARQAAVRDAATNAAYRKRQAIVDGRMATLGVACAETLARKAPSPLSCAPL